MGGVKPLKAIRPMCAVSIFITVSRESKGPTNSKPKNPLGNSASCFENSNCNWEDVAYSKEGNELWDLQGSEEVEADSDLLTLRVNQSKTLQEKALNLEMPKGNRIYQTGQRQPRKVQKSSDNSLGREQSQETSASMVQDSWIVQYNRRGTQRAEKLRKLAK